MKHEAKAELAINGGPAREDDPEFSPCIRAVWR